MDKVVHAPAEVTAPTTGPAAGSDQVGVWFVGAKGSVATTALVGALAIRDGLATGLGCVSELPELADAPLPGFERLVFGGHDVTDAPYRKRAEDLAAQAVIPAQLLAPLTDALARADAEVRHVVTDEEAARQDAGAAQRAQVARLRGDLADFAERHRLARVVVVDVSSTHAPVDAEHPDLASAAAVRQAWDAGRAPLPASAVHPWAAFEAGAGYVAFTPSPGVDLPCLVDLGRETGATWAGADGKTGETLLKSVLAPMFVQRALRVDSWASVNLLGGGDGDTLSDPVTARSKTSTKAAGLEAMLGRHVPGPLHIDYVPDMGDWKTAWDQIRFSGFLGTAMTLQFTWQGCDSALAAPLVLDLARLTAACMAAGRTGPVSELGFFFKNPLGSDEHALAVQWQDLLRLVGSFAESPASVDLSTPELVTPTTTR
ncbi:inositol-3-phosphate synthase [Aquipuribacter sp. MA13-6]|uniref:inositol-3-phosphate synthase n=1 Tax=unclassified Aquipuribacter TaxID=2635084 RepID=UPI003EE92AF6